MGIKDLMKVISEHSPKAIKKINIKQLFGRKIAIDVSMYLYQFLIAIQPGDTNKLSLTNNLGETTSHLGGIFYRTIKMIETGIKPIYVFDGKPPELKNTELDKRAKRRREAQDAMTDAKEKGNLEILAKFNKRTVHVTLQQNKEACRLLQLMGIPVVQAPSEAEAQCAALVKSGICYGSGSEDMDSLTLGCKILIRYLSFSESRGIPIIEIHLEMVLIGLGLTFDQFIDLCILLGCDYCASIKGIGSKKAVQFIKKYGSIEKILENLNTEKYKVPENFNYQEVRQSFKNPLVDDSKNLIIEWNDPDENGILEYLVKQKGFSEERVKRGIERLKMSRKVHLQSRITSFFQSKSSYYLMEPIPKKSKVEDVTKESSNSTGAKSSITSNEKCKV